MTFIGKSTKEELAASLATCGGDGGPMFMVAKGIAEGSEGELSELVPPMLSELAQGSLSKLEALAENGVITPTSILFRYGLPAHFHEMNTEAQKGMDSVAREIPGEVRAFFHTLLPLQEGIYRNKDVEVTLQGLIPLGPQEGHLVAHLAGVFSSNCSEEDIARLLESQAEDPAFMAIARKAKEFDYRGTILAKATERAKKELGL